MQATIRMTCQRLEAIMASEAWRSALAVPAIHTSSMTSTLFWARLHSVEHRDIIEAVSAYLATSKHKHPATNKGGTVALSLLPRSWVRRLLGPTKIERIKAPHITEANTATTTSGNHQLVSVAHSTVRLPWAWAGARNRDLFPTLLGDIVRVQVINFGTSSSVTTKQEQLLVQKRQGVTFSCNWHLTDWHWSGPSSKCRGPVRCILIEWS
mmetsp:Transcript_64052/g.105096  ORF Transcript_64052/g.105096 Transcript_64052/m.105096 type:complete len:210 (-) Transcript_64052:566-1195(-)